MCRRRRLREEHSPFPDLLPSPSGELQLWGSKTPRRGQKVVEEGKGREAQNRAGDDIADDRAVWWTLVILVSDDTTPIYNHLTYCNRIQYIDAHRLLPSSFHIKYWKKDQFWILTEQPKHMSLIQTFIIRLKELEGVIIIITANNFFMV